VEVDAFEEGAAGLAAIEFEGPSGAGAFTDLAATVAAKTGVHGGDERVGLTVDGKGSP
jgi:hypothetical protein